MAVKTNKTPLFDVVIPTAGRFDLLEVAVNSIYSNADIPISVTIVADGIDKEEIRRRSIFSYNSEKDRGGNIVKWDVVRMEKKSGFIKTANRGAKIGTAEFICFISDDIEILPGFFRAMLKVFESQEIGICGARLRFPTNSASPARPAGKIQHVGIAMDIGGNVIHPMIGWSDENPKTKVSREAFAVTGAAFSIRRKLFKATGGFDEIYGKGYWEDVDLCLKVRSLGYRIWIESSANAFHYTNATSEIDNSFGSDFLKNAMTFRMRWGQSGLLVWDEWTY